MAQRATSLGPKPSSFFAFNRKKPFLPSKKGISVYLSVFLCFSLALNLASPFSPSSFFACLLSFYFFLPSCFSCQFLGFAFCFCFVCFFFQDVLLFLFFCLLFCFVWNHYIIYCLALHLVFLLLLLLFCCVFALIFSYFLIFGYLSKTSLKTMEIPETPK